MVLGKSYRAPPLGLEVEEQVQDCPWVAGQPSLHFLNSSYQQGFLSVRCPDVFWPSLGAGWLLPAPVGKEQVVIAQAM